MPRRLDKTWTDYVAIGICPLLIMLLVGSLMYFLLLVGYSGGYDQRLRMVMGCFVMAIVLIGRISMEDGAEKASVYGVALTGAMALAVMRFIEHPLAAWIVLAIVWWSAHKLTWDCTLIDEQEDATGEGLLQAAGLDTEGNESDTPAAPLQGKGPANVPWWQRLLGPRKKKTSAPGVWVVYFSFAALPLYGLGQRFIPSDNLDARRAAFWYLIVYVASALGLLLATALLGLRRYLRQRNLTMPLSVTGMWVGSGAALIALVLAFCTLIPRPNPEYAASSVTGRLGSQEQESSDYAQLSDSGVQSGEQGASGEPAAQPSEQAPMPDQQGSQDQTSAQQNQQGQPSQVQGSQGDQSAGQGQQAGDKGKPGEGTSEAGQAAKSQAGSQGQPSSASDQAATDQAPQQAQRPAQPPSERTQTSNSSPKSPSSMPRMPELGTIGRWVLNAILIAAVLFALFRYRRQLVTGFQQLLASIRQFFQQLFGKPTAAVGQAGETETATQRGSAFADFPNPFNRAIQGVRTPEQVVAYSFRALEAWAAEHGTPRQPQETPWEFADRLGESHQQVAKPLRDLATLFARLNYGNQRLPPNSLSSVRTFWDALELHQAARG